MCERLPQASARTGLHPLVGKGQGGFADSLTAPCRQAGRCAACSLFAGGAVFPGGMAAAAGLHGPRLIKLLPLAVRLSPAFKRRSPRLPVFFLRTFRISAISSELSLYLVDSFITQLYSTPLSIIHEVF